MKKTPQADRIDVLLFARARKLKLNPVTLPYSPGEQWMLENVCDDLRRAGSTFVILEVEKRGVVFKAVCRPIRDTIGLGHRVGERSAER